MNNVMGIEGDPREKFIGYQELTGNLVLVFNLEKTSGVSRDIVLTVTILILPYLLPILLWYQDNRFVSSCLLLI